MPQRENFFRDCLQLGDTGSDVRALQIFLYGLENTPGNFSVTGEFDSETVRALQGLQLDLGMIATGKFDEETRNVLQSEWYLDLNYQFEEIIAGAIEVLELVGDDEGENEEDEHGDDDADDVVEEDKIEPDQNIPVQAVPGGNPWEGDIPVS